MANVDNPNGFACIGNDAGQILVKTIDLATSQTITKGDALILSSGQAAIAEATSGLLLGVAAESLTTGATALPIMFWPATLDNIFIGQCSGTYAATTDDLTVCDIEGTTGIMELNENATTESVVQILGLVEDGINIEGANSRVKFKIVRSSYTPVLAAL